jgi:molecular chaperone DnaK (HSP70)
LSLGIELGNGKMDFIIERNTIIPIICTKRYKTIKDNQTKIKLRVYQGERLIANKNQFLGEYIIENIPKKPKGKVQIDVTFNFDINGIINATAELIDSKQKKNIDIKMIYLNEDKINKLVEEGKKMKENDLKILKGRNDNYENNDLIDNIEENILKLSLGIESTNGEMKTIIQRNSKIPIKNSFLYNAEINDNKILLKVYQGERILALGNELLKKIEINSNEKTKFIKLDITFELNEDLNLIVICKNINSGKIISNTKIQINNQFEQEKIEDQVETAKNMEKNDRKKLKQKNCKNEFIQYALKMVEKGNEALEWAESHQKEEAEVYIQKLKNLKEI